jgi:hypothetical protein
MTKRPEIFERAVIRSSVIPSTKYSWSGSSLMLSNGSTAIEGLSGSGKAMRSIEAGSTVGSHGRSQAARPPNAVSRAKQAAAAHPHGGVSRLLEPVTLPMVSGSISTR